MTPETRGRAEWERLRRAVRDEPLPLALVDLDAFDANVARLVGSARAAKKRLRVASKSVRCPSLLARIRDAGPGVVFGVMAYSARECGLLLEHGWDDVLVAYPTVQADALATVARANANGARCAIVVDCVAHVDALARAAREMGAQVPAIVDVDVSFRPAARVHVGVRRSPLRTARDVTDLAAYIADRRELRFEGIMAYEAHIAGLADVNVARRAMKALARPRVVATRAAIVEALAAKGLPARIVNGGGTGSLHANVREVALTEVTVGSGFLASHLFDGYDGLGLRPAAYFALEVARRPTAHIVTCHGGGFVASGAAGRDRLPRPVLPPGLELLALEGAGEVQTPLRVPSGVALGIGDPVFFRHAKAGELAEHVAEYVLVRGDEAIGRAPTYRGLGHCFLG
jgi:D-serine deaminase-like pyridoxal phosphate-dependent protein